MTKKARLIRAYPTKKPSDIVRGQTNAKPDPPGVYRRHFGEKRILLGMLKKTRAKFNVFEHIQSLNANLCVIASIVDTQTPWAQENSCDFKPSKLIDSLIYTKTLGPNSGRFFLHLLKHCLDTSMLRPHVCYIVLCYRSFEDFDLALLVATSFASPESSSMKFLLFEEQNLIFFVHIYPKHLIFLADRAELDWVLGRIW